MGSDNPRALDGTEKLCRILYNRPPQAGDYIGGSDARMLHDAHAGIQRLTARVAELERVVGSLMAATDGLCETMDDEDGRASWTSRQLSAARAALAARDAGKAEKAVAAALQEGGSDAGK